MFEAALLGLVEGLTEFLPVSSTGHLILVGDLLGFQGPQGRVFEIVIQLGAILAVCWMFRGRLANAAAGLLDDPAARAFAGNILLAFLPAMVVGYFAHGFIKSALFNPWVVSVTMILGGFAILIIERVAGHAAFDRIEALPAGISLRIGLFQCLAMIPGVSRSGATIMGALLMRVDRRTATEFSFFLAIPTMLAATVYDVYKNRATLEFDNALLILIGFVTAFLSALVVVRILVSFVSRHGFAPFALYRIVVGSGMLALLALR